MVLAAVLAASMLMLLAGCSRISEEGPAGSVFLQGASTENEEDSDAAIIRQADPIIRFITGIDRNPGERNRHGRQLEKYLENCSRYIADALAESPDEECAGEFHIDILKTVVYDNGIVLTADVTFPEEFHELIAAGAEGEDIWIEPRTICMTAERPLLSDTELEDRTFPEVYREIKGYDIGYSDSYCMARQLGFDPSENRVTFGVYYSCGYSFEEGINYVLMLSDFMCNDKAAELLTAAKAEADTELFMLTRYNSQSASSGDHAVSSGVSACEVRLTGSIACSREAKIDIPDVMSGTVSISPVSCTYDIELLDPELQEESFWLAFNDSHRDSILDLAAAPASWTEYGNARIKMNFMVPAVSSEDIEKLKVRISGTVSQKTEYEFSFEDTSDRMTWELPGEEPGAGYAPCGDYVMNWNYNAQTEGELQEFLPVLTLNDTDNSFRLIYSAPDKQVSGYYTEDMSESIVSSDMITCVTADGRFRFVFYYDNDSKADTLRFDAWRSSPVYIILSPDQEGDYLWDQTIFTRQGSRNR